MQSYRCAPLIELLDTLLSGEGGWDLIDQIGATMCRTRLCMCIRIDGECYGVAKL